MENNHNTHLKEHVKEAAKDVNQMVKEGTDKFKEKVEDAGHKVKEGTEKLVEKTKDALKDHPTKDHGKHDTHSQV